MKRSAFGYLRVSSDGQINGDGFERQKTAIEAYAKQNGITIKGIFQESISGTVSPLEREGFKNLLEALLSNGTKIVLVENLSRLARDLMVQETILNDLKQRGLELISVNEPDLASDDPSRKMIRQVMGAFYEYEKQLLVLKLKAARERKKKKTGRCEGNLPYGSKPGEYQILKRILNATETANKIAGQLNIEGIKTRSGGKWYGSNVVKIIKANRKSRA